MPYESCGFLGFFPTPLDMSTVCDPGTKLENERCVVDTEQYTQMSTVCDLGTKLENERCVVDTEQYTKIIPPGCKPIENFVGHCEKDFVKHEQGIDISGCEDLCNSSEWCKAFSYQQSSKVCALYRSSCIEWNREYFLNNSKLQYKSYDCSKGNVRLDTSGVKIREDTSKYK
jgi:hypothetical protein